MYENVLGVDCELKWSQRVALLKSPAFIADRSRATTGKDNEEGSLPSNRLDLLDLLGQQSESIGVYVFFHMLRLGRAGGRKVPERESKIVAKLPLQSVDRGDGLP